MDQPSPRAESDKSDPSTHQSPVEHAVFQTPEKQVLETNHTPQDKYHSYYKWENAIKGAFRWCKDKAQHTGLHDWIMIIFTAVLTAVAILQIALAFLQFTNARNATIDATRSQQASDMPFVYLVRHLPEVGGEVEGKPQLIIHQWWVNRGQSRADHPVITWGFSDSVPAPGTQYPYASVLDLHKTSIPVGGEFDEETTIPLPVVERLESGQKVYLSGRIVYKDVFPAHDGEHIHLVEYVVEISDFRKGGAVAPSWTTTRINSGACYDRACDDYGQSISAQK